MTTGFHSFFLAFLGLGLAGTVLAFLEGRLGAKKEEILVFLDTSTLRRRYEKKKKKNDQIRQRERRAAVLTFCPAVMTGPFSLLASTPPTGRPELPGPWAMLARCESVPVRTTRLGSSMPK